MAVETATPALIEPSAQAALSDEVETPGEAKKFPTRNAVNYSVANLGSSVFYGLFNYGMPLYLGAYHLDAWLIGLLANERSFIGAIVQPIVGRISDRTHSRFGKRRPFFLVGIPLVCVGLFALALHPSFWPMLAIMSVLAFFLAVAWDPYMAMIGDLFSEDQRGRVGGLIGLGSGIGFTIFALLGLFLWGKSEFSVFMIVIGGLVITWTYTFLTVKEPSTAGKTDVPRGKVGKPNPIAYIKNVMQYPQAARYTLAVTFFWMGTGGVQPFITPFGVRVLHATESEAFILPLAATIATALLAVPLGMLADRTNKKAVMVGGMIAFGLVGIIGSQAQTLWQGAIVMALAGCANSAMSLINPMLSDLVPRKRMAEFIGLGSAVFSFAQPLGSVVAGLVVGIATWFMGNEDQAYRWAFLTAGVMLITAALLLRTVHPERANVEDEEVVTGDQLAVAGSR